MKQLFEIITKFVAKNKRQRKNYCFQIRRLIQGKVFKAFCKFVPM